MTKEARLWGGGRAQDPDQNSSTLNNTKATPSPERGAKKVRGGMAGNGMGDVRGRLRQSS